MTGPSSIREHLSAARRELLDFGLRNPLLNYRTTKARGLDVHDELPAEVYRILVEDGRAMSFLPVPERNGPKEDLFEGEIDESGEFEGDLSVLLAGLSDEEKEGTASRHTDTKLQTPYTTAKLQSRLLSTFYAARTFIEEQGVNVLYLALGMLEWYEDESSDKVRRAPLLLVPVELTRTDARARFRLRYTDDDIGGNLTLQAKLKGDFGLTIDLPDPEKDLDVEDYVLHVADVVSEMPRWRVDENAVHLGFFLFGKLLMYNDLDVSAWPEDAKPTDHEVIRSLLGSGFEPFEGRIGDDEHLDRHLDLGDVHQVVDADGSQTLALLDVKGGHHLVIQGPPGTGKSQTITNVIAEAVGQGKTVLFVAEKMAALDVVKRRLDAVELGEACLELHSHKTSKKDLLAGLEQTLKLGKPHADVLRADLDVLVDARDQLNDYAEAVNTEVRSTGFTPQIAYGRLLKLDDRWADVDHPEDIERTDSGMLDWERSDYARRRARIQAMQSLIGQMGRPSDHPFWGSKRIAVLPSEQPQIVTVSRKAALSLHQLEEIANELADSLGLAADTPSDVDVLVRAGLRALSAPDLRGVRVDADEWFARRADIAELIERGKSYADLRSHYADSLIPEAWDADVLEARQHLAAHGEKWYRLFIGDWRRAKAQLSGLMTEPLPKEHTERLQIADGILRSQRIRKEIDAFSSLGSGLYGLQWEGHRSDWTVLQRVAEWMAELHADVASGNVPRGLVAFLAGGPDLDALEPLVTRAASAVEESKASLTSAAKLINFDVALRFGWNTPLEERKFSVLQALTEGWADNAHRLQEIVTYSDRADKMADDELILFADVAAWWEDSATHLVYLFDTLWFTTILDEAYVTRKALAGFNGSLHTEAARRFADKDEISLLYNRARLALGHWENLPRHGLGRQTSGQLGVLQHEFGKKRRHMPIRKLMTRAGRVIQAIKPVFMMSPMSVAAYLPPGSVDFDLVVFDEASQVKPVDAFGALLRGTQAVVVGDSKQLPPTSFFDTVVHDDDEEDDETGNTSDIESVLELFKSKQAPERMLRWHYRSRHESLIAVSNKEFYDNKLVTFPSPDAEQAEVGLAYHHLPDARYDRGGRRTNREEAKAIARAIAAHAAATPHYSLMVATFSQAQQKEVRDQVDLLSLTDPVLNAFVNRADTLERFDVKNLENVQGDERDIVFISVGYGRDQNGAVAMNFGPLNKEGGERRLNVLISRARRRCEVFTNLRADDIDLSRTQARGVASFKRYLQFASTGQLEMAEPTGGDYDSPFEEAVATALRDLGYRIEPQVGVGSFRIDLAVVDPKRPGRYVLGIECDGATYHRARTARDRDRIRQSVLEGLGWQIHRIWSTDWFRSPDEELKRTVAAIESAKAEPVVSERREEPAPTLKLTRSDAPVPEPVVTETEPYRRAVVSGYSDPLHEVSMTLISRDIAKIVYAESPVHIEEVGRRIMDASGVSRMGRRIREAIERGARLAVRAGSVERRGDFLYAVGQEQSDIRIRDRSGLPTNSRSFDYIAPEEVRVAISEVLTSSYGISAEDLAPEVCRMFGFGQTSAQMRAAIEDALSDMRTAGTVTNSRGMLTLTSLDSTDYDALL